MVKAYLCQSLPMLLERDVALDIVPHLLTVGDCSSLVKADPS